MCRLLKTPRDTWQYRWRVAAIAALGSGLLRVLGWTWRIRHTGVAPFDRGPFVAALWHQGLFCAAVIWRGRGISVPVSQSRDGDLIASVLARLGFAESPRGSSSRGASALLRSMIRIVRRGDIVAMLPDGPRGPAAQAKPGIVALASAAQVPLLPVGIAAAPGWRFASWDRAILPYPFAIVRCHYGEPMVVPKRVRGEELANLVAKLESELDRLNREAEARL